MCNVCFEQWADPSLDLTQWYANTLVHKVYTNLKKYAVCNMCFEQWADPSCVHLCNMCFEQWSDPSVYTVHLCTFVYICWKLCETYPPPCNEVLGARRQGIVVLLSTAWRKIGKNSATGGLIPEQAVKDIQHVLSQLLRGMRTHTEVIFSPTPAPTREPIVGECVSCLSHSTRTQLCFHGPA